MFHRRRRQADFSAEIQAHIAFETDRLREEGLSPSEARAAALRKFGNRLAAEERFYERSRTIWMEDIRKDLRYAVRALLRAPTFAITAIVTLALGIGANTAIFTVADAVLLRPLPFPEPDRVVALYEKLPGADESPSAADYIDYKHQTKSFESLAAYRVNPVNLSGQNRPERVDGTTVTSNFFAVFGVLPELGRTLTPQQDPPGGALTAVLADSLWKRRYGEDPGIIGKSILVNGEPRVVVGIMPPAFRFPGETEIWESSRFRVPDHPLRPMVDESNDRGSYYFDSVGRLRKGVSISQAQSETTLIAARLKKLYGDDEETDRTHVVSLHDDLVGGTRPAVLILLVSVALLLLIACANVANIMLARGATRHKEIAIRGALGARRWRIIRQFLVESVLLASAGGVTGILAARSALGPLQRLMPADLIPSGGLAINLPVMIFTLMVAIAAGLIFGLFPAVQTAKVDVNDALKEGGRTSHGGNQANHIRGALVVSEIALAAVLLIGAGLLIRSFARLLSVPEGFSPDHVLTLQLSLASAQYPKPEDRVRFIDGMLDKIRSVPGVASAGIISRLPLLPGVSARGINIKGRTPSTGDISPDYLVTSPGYFRTMGIPLVEGRTFTQHDSAASASVVMINQASARHFWPAGDLLGQYIKGATKDWSPVIGVVADVHQHRLGEVTRPAVYVPYTQDPWPLITVVLRTSMEPAGAASAATVAIHQIDPDQPVFNIRTMDEVISASVSHQRFRTLLLSLFAGLALALASVGIYGVMAYSVTQRSHEIGIRMALGAEPGRLRLFVIGEGLKLALSGVLIGVILSIPLTHLLSSVLYGVRPTDAPAFAGSFLFLILVTLLAAYLPARRATRVDPVAALRVE